MNKVKCLNKLNGRYRAEIRELESLCNHHDKTNWKVCLSTDPYNEDMKCFYLYFEKDLLGFLELTSLEEEEMEVFAFVHPAARNRGIFTKLMREAIRECKKFGLKELLCYLNPKYISNHKDGCMAALSSLHGVISYSEYQLELSLIGKRIDEQAKDMKDIKLKKVTKDLEDVYCNQMQELFEMEVEDVKERLSMAEEDSHTGIYSLYEKESCIGFLSLYYGKTAVTLFDFGIIKEYQGKGYATAALFAMLRHIHSLDKKGWSNVLLHVSSRNQIATALYQKFGFRIKDQLDCYKIPVL